MNTFRWSIRFVHGCHVVFIQNSNDAKDGFLLCFKLSSRITFQSWTQEMRMKRKIKAKLFQKYSREVGDRYKWIFRRW